MLHPSYSDLMKVVNSEVEVGEAPVVNSRYSIVMATSKRARQLIDGDIAIFQGQDFCRVVCNQVDVMNMQGLEHGPRTFKLSQVIGVPEHLVGSEGINALVLQQVGIELGVQANTAPFLTQIDQYATPSRGYLRQGFFELGAAIATL